MENIQQEILGILIENGYSSGDVTNDTYIYENCKGIQIVIERPENSPPPDDANRFRPHSAYVSDFFESADTCNDLLKLYQKGSSNE
jgi:hypothetical protein